MSEDDAPPADVDEVATCIRRSSVPIRTGDPTADVGDLEPLRDRFEGKTVVGLGESTHGTREFFRLKHRLFRFLVEELGFRLFAWEANFAATMPIDEFVRHGRGDPVAALSSEAIHWPMRSQAVNALLTWLRTFNEGRDPDDQVKVYGFDMQYPSDAVATVGSFLEDVDPGLLEGVREDVDGLAESGAVEMANPDERAKLVERADRVVAALEEPFEGSLPAYVGATSRTDAHRARRCLRTLAQWVDQRRSENPLRVRDRAMADNVAWILDHESADRIALWGHNAHVKRGIAAGGALGIEAPSMGEHLHRKYGDRYEALGFEFGRGSFRAHSLPDNEFRTHAIETPPPGSIPDVFGAVEESPFVFDTAGIPAEPALAEWLDGHPRRHVIVGSYEEDPVSYVESSLADCFDGLVFVAETTPTTPTERVYPELDFEPE